MISLSLPHTADLVTYKESLNYPSIFEPGFALLIFLLKKFFTDVNTVITVLQVILTLIIFFGLCVGNKENNLTRLALLAIFGLGAFMSAHNGLRQGYAAAIFMIGFLGRKPKLFFYLIAITFHYSILILILIEWLVNSSLRNKLWGGALILVGAIFFIEVLEKYTMYLNFDVASSAERINPFIKILILCPFFIISNKHIERKGLRLLRLALFTLMIAASLNPSTSELFARINMYYWIVELYALLYFPSIIRNFILFSYLVAPNAIKLYL